MTLDTLDPKADFKACILTDPDGSKFWIRADEVATFSDRGDYRTIKMTGRIAAYACRESMEVTIERPATLKILRRIAKSSKSMRSRYKATRALVRVFGMQDFHDQ